jgi:hypothetical protein
MGYRVLLESSKIYALVFMRSYAPVDTMSMFSLNLELQGRQVNYHAHSPCGSMIIDEIWMMSLSGGWTTLAIHKYITQPKCITSTRLRSR